MQNYTSNTLHHLYNSRRNDLLTQLKQEKDEEKKKSIHLALLSADLTIQLFNDANRDFPIINNEITKHANESISLVKNRSSSIKKLKKAINTFNSFDSDILERRMHYSLELSESKGKKIPPEIASNILKESSFLFNHVLHTLYDNKEQNKVFEILTAFVEYVLGINLIEPISSGKEVYKEILQERVKYRETEDMHNELENFIFNAHHFSLMTLLFVKHWMGFKTYGLEEAEMELNEKINDILKQRKNTPN